MGRDRAGWQSGWERSPRIVAGLLLAIAAMTAGGCSTGTVEPGSAPGYAPGSCHARGTGLYALPDPHCTPGAVDPAVTQPDIDATICRAGYAAAVRPPESVTEPEKLASMAAYGETGPPGEYEYDHLIPLELGGAGHGPRHLGAAPGGGP